MSWFRLDDKFHSNPKIIAAGNAAVGLYARGGCYCADHNTDGFIPMAVAQLYGKPREIAALLEIGLWTPADKGYVMPDYLDFNPSAREVEERRLKRAEAGSVGGTRSGVSRRSKHEANASTLVGDCLDSCEATTNPDPTPPLPLDRSSSQLQVRDNETETMTLKQRVADAIDWHATTSSIGKDNPIAYASKTRFNCELDHSQALTVFAAADPSATREQIARAVLGTKAQVSDDVKHREAWYANPHCATCDGTGVRVVDDGGAGTGYPCDCRRDEPHLATVTDIRQAAV